ncbi:endonuclease [Leptolyngbya sp. 'hensonii']|uniref:EndoU domain-containing protein n=1 Tax=Leptolyngbya sp. 'hensonii' TaxID=1922337 RepID=UPI00096508B5|nr:EndoU domain-containing protein [Leptolyngbya sp. 'hensonii']OLP16470.1 endonuclease [Leptolyngbya sp. 'hensonii']
MTLQFKLKSLGGLLLGSCVLLATGESDQAISTGHPLETIPQQRAMIQAQFNPPWFPFFDQVNNPISVRFPASQRVDITPPPPPVSGFDQAILKLCGPIGSSVSPQGFRQLMASYPTVFRQIKQATGGELSLGRSQDAEFLEDLTRIWFKQEAFVHIFCGEISGSRKIGGLHFRGRYLQLQTEGMGGRLPNNTGREEVVPGVVYTLGVVIKRGNQLIRDSLKGYSYVTDGQELLTIATIAFKAQDKTEGACLYPVTDADSGQSFRAVFVRQRGAIVTFYPDATPQGRSCQPPR